MRNTILLCFITLVLISQTSAQPSLQIQPEKPQAGREITITYNPSSTVLKGVSDFKAYAYLLDGNLPIVQEIPLVKSGNNWTGSFLTNDTTKATFITFSKRKIKDNNNDKGYYIYMYTATGDPVPGSRMMVGVAMRNFVGIWGLPRDEKISAQLMNQEFEAYPESKYTYRYEYLDKLRLSNNPADKVEIEKLLEIIQAQPNLSETDFSQVKFYYERILSDKEKSAAVDKAVMEIYPNGDWVRERRMMALQDEQDQAKREALFIAYQKDFPPKTKEEENMIEFFAADLAISYGNAGNYEKMKGYAAMIKNKSYLASLYNDIAWKLAGEGLNGIAGDISMGRKLSWQSLQLILEAAKESDGRPTYYTEKQWKEQMERSYYMYTDTYALVLYRLGDYIPACDYEQKAVEFNNREDLSMNEMYTLYLKKCKGAAAAEKELENFVREGHSTSAMKEELKKLYIARSHTETQWNEYVTTLEKADKEKQKRVVVTKMIKEQAPSFSLKDLKGNEVSLASLKGKVVVLDFWATWCGPCIASFPAMKKTMEKYQQDPDVKFVFINTWENGEKEKVRKDISAFIEKNDWPFNMLMDYENTVVEEYGVEGIPTKFVIDKNNLIRFKSFGFSGSTEELVDELSQMIELARKGE